MLHCLLPELILLERAISLLDRHVRAAGWEDPEVSFLGSLLVSTNYQSRIRKVSIETHSTLSERESFNQEIQIWSFQFQ